jgi:hypothetical protein
MHSDTMTPLHSACTATQPKKTNTFEIIYRSLSLNLSTRVQLSFHQPSRTQQKHELVTNSSMPTAPPHAHSIISPSPTKQPELMTNFTVSTAPPHALSITSPNTLSWISHTCKRS